MSWACTAVTATDRVIVISCLVCFLCDYVFRLLVMQWLLLLLLLLLKFIQNIRLLLIFLLLLLLITRMWRSTPRRQLIRLLFLVWLCIPLNLQRQICYCHIIRLGWYLQTWLLLNNRLLLLVGVGRILLSFLLDVVKFLSELFSVCAAQIQLLILFWLLLALN